jgi:anti-sigma-K factor RskA
MTDRRDRPDEGHVEDLLPAYAVGAADVEERAVVEAHLYQCRQCSLLLAEYEEAAHSLAALASLGAPSPRVRTAVMERTASRADAGRPAARRMASWLPVGVGAAAGMLLGLSLGVGAMAVQVQSELDESERSIAELQEVVRQERVVSYMAAAPNTSVLVLEPATEDTEGYAMLMGSSSGKLAILVAGGMNPAPPGMAYQLWLTRDGQREDGGVFAVDDTGWAHVEVRQDWPITEVDRVGVTMEPAAGSPSPTSPPIFFWGR